jgi:hypothetical protein
MTFVPCDRASSILQGSIWKEYLSLFQNSPVATLPAMALFSTMRQLFPNSAVGLANEDSSYRVFGLGRINVEGANFPLRDLYEGRGTSNGTRVDIPRAEYSTGFTLALKAQPSAPGSSATAGPSQPPFRSIPKPKTQHLTNTTREPVPTGKLPPTNFASQLEPTSGPSTNLTSELAAVINARQDMPPRVRSGREFRKEWKFLDGTVWPPTVCCDCFFRILNIAN